MNSSINPSVSLLKHFENKVYESKEGYCIAGLIKPIGGVSHRMNNSMVLEPVMAELMVYEKDYEIRVKDTEASSSDGKTKYKSVPMIASVFEQQLCKLIKSSPDYWIPKDKMISGMIDFLPDMQFENIGSQPELIAEKIASCCNIKEIAVSGKVPTWEQKTYRSNNSYSKGISLDEKVAFIKQDLIATVGNEDNKETDSIGKLLASFHVNNAPVNDEQYAKNYIDLLRAIVS
ncbi:MAG: hypothetical protein Tsb0014_35670 [Pleurocapsa sp.]